MIRELVNRIVFDVVNQRDLDRSNRAVDQAADNASSASQASDRYRASVLRLSSSLRTGLRNVGRFTGGLLRLGRSLNPLASIGGLLSTAGIIGFGVSALNAAGDVEESVDRMQVALGGLAQGAEREIRRVSSTLGVNRNQFREFFTDFALQLENSVGIERASELAQEITERAFDVGSFQNVSSEDVFAAFRAGINGSSEPLDRFNVNIRASAVDQFILANGLARTSREIDENTRRYGRLLLILRETQNAQGNLVLTANSFTNLSRAVRASLQEIVADIGAEFLPTARQFLSSLLTLIRNNTDEIIDFFSRAADRIELFINSGGLQDIAGGFQSIARAAVIAANAVDRVFNISDREQEIEAEQRLIVNRAFSERGIVERTLFPFLSGAENSRQQAEDRVNARAAFANFGGVPSFVPVNNNVSSINQGATSSVNQDVTSSVNQQITVNVSGGAANNQAAIESAVRRGANSGGRATLSSIAVPSPNR